MDDLSFRPDWFSKPGDTLLTLMEQRELTAENLARKLGCASSVVQGVFAGTVAIDEKLAHMLSRHVGGTPKFWETRQRKYQIALSEAAHSVPPEDAFDWIANFPHSDMAKLGWIKNSRNRDELFKSYLAYFGVNDPAEWRERYADFLKITAFRTSATYQSKVGPLSAWLRKGEIEAAQIQCDPWSPSALRERFSELRVLCKAKNPSYFLPRIRQICADIGVAVVFVRAPSGCSASGATRFISPQKAMIILSFRHLSDDHFWFTFFHELGHLLLHARNITFIDGEEPISSKMEKEANKFSERALIPDNMHERLLDLPANRDRIIRFAYAAGVSAGIVVGQMQHHGVIKQQQMNFLKRRFTWDQISAAVS